MRRKFTIYLVLCAVLHSNSFTAWAAKMSKEDLAKKKQVPYFVGLPLINASSDNGVGYGARVYWYDPGTEKDEYFDSTPYFTSVYLQFFKTTYGQQYHTLHLDKYNVGGSKLRIKTEIIYDASKNANFFGIGKDSSDQKLTGNSVEYDKYSDYYDNFLNAGPTNYNNRKYNNYSIEKPTFSFKAYYNLLEWLKVMAALQVMHVDVNPWGGRDFKNKTINGEDYTAQLY
jgi:hypothetical protein